MSAAQDRPIGVFDSGVGGLSVLRALQAELPQERFVYVADNGHAPYGERDDAHVLRRSHAIADFFVASHGIKALVVACNTATAAAIHTLRAVYPMLPIIGIEPALKPAAANSQTGVVGVMATRATLNSEKFARLLESLHGKATFVLQPCDGLADAIERSDTTRTLALCSDFTRAMGRFGQAPGEMDTLVLGCTHYAFAAPELQSMVGGQTVLLEGGAPVARQTRRLLEAAHTLRGLPEPGGNRQDVAPAQFYSTGNVRLLDSALQRWLHIRASATALDLN
ncbi:glutamate racemase [Rhodoferax lacus]|uniref:Glutamate racemase n=1 Tax=Rhodoferax lacus TaxID=2184758 RepID=A0A3E1RHX8_9BURK|nr:glutamate racemase [Rhodoferax lacus]RFO98968.1 glutamate racemase [Rhodoferax lacus]